MQRRREKRREGENGSGFSATPHGTLAKTFDKASNWLVGQAWQSSLSPWHTHTHTGHTDSETDYVETGISPSHTHITQLQECKLCKKPPQFVLNVWETVSAWSFNINFMLLLIFLSFHHVSANWHTQMYVYMRAIESWQGNTSEHVTKPKGVSCWISYRLIGFVMLNQSKLIDFANNSSQNRCMYKLVKHKQITWMPVKCSGFHCLLLRTTGNPRPRDLAK